MSKLEDLKQRMYSLGFLGRRRRENTPGPEQPSQERPWEETPEEMEKRKAAEKRHKAVSILAGVIVGFSILFAIGYGILQSGILFYFLGRTEVELTIESPDTAVAGDKVTYSVVYTNKSRNPIKNLELFFEYPKGSEPVESPGEVSGSGSEIKRVRVLVPDVEAGAEGHADFRAKVLGQEGAVLNARATLLYVPEGVTSKFTVSKDQKLQISRVPIALSLKSLSRIKSGDSYNFTIDYASNATTDFKNLALRVSYPEGFQFRDSSVRPEFKDTKQIVWRLGDIQPGSSGSVDVQGVLGGALLEPKTFQYGIGTYTRETKEWSPYIERTSVVEIVSSPLAVETRVGDSRTPTASFGQDIQARVIYRNNSDVALKNVSVTVSLEGVADLSTLRAQNGSVIGSRQVQWTPASEPSLAALGVGEERSLSFSFKVKPGDKVGSIKNANVTIRATVKSDAGANINFVPEGSDTLIIPIEAAPVFEAKALYSGSLLKNSGPIPPRVGQKTTYAIIWEVSSFGGDLQNVIMKAKLPPDVQWESIIVPSSENMAYQKSTGEVVWNAGSIRSDIDSGAVRRVMFKVSIVPSESQIGQQAMLVHSIVGTGTDVFTNKDFEVRVREITTNLLDDFGIPPNSGSIQP